MARMPTKVVKKLIDGLTGAADENTPIFPAPKPDVFPRMTSVGEHPAWRLAMNEPDAVLTSDEILGKMADPNIDMSNLTPRDWLEFYRDFPLFEIGSYSDRTKMAEAAAQLYGADTSRMQILGNSDFLNLPAGIQQKLWERPDIDFELFNDRFAWSDLIKEERDRYQGALAGMREFIPNASGPAGLLRNIQNDPGLVNRMTPEQVENLNTVLQDTMPPEEYADYIRRLPEEVRDLTTEAATQRANRRGNYQQEMGELLEEAGAEDATFQGGETGYMYNPTTLTAAFEDARERGVRPLTTETRDKTLGLAERLNRSTVDGTDPNITDEDLLGVDWQLLRENIDLPMDENSRLARAAEQGFTWGLDEDIWRGTVEGGNLRRAPGLTPGMATALEEASGRNVLEGPTMTQWGSSDPEIAASYTRFPSPAFRRPMYLEDFANQDYLEGLPRSFVRDQNVSIDPSYAGNAQFRVAMMPTPYEYQGAGEMFNELNTARLRDLENPNIQFDEIPTSTDELLDQSYQGDRNNRIEPYGIRFRNIIDPGSNMREVARPSDVYAIPLARTRNRDLAMFHPLLQGRRNLLAQLAAGAAIPYSLYNEDEQLE